MMKVDLDKEYIKWKKEMEDKMDITNPDVVREMQEDIMQGSGKMQKCGIGFMLCGAVLTCIGFNPVFFPLLFFGIPFIYLGGKLYLSMRKGRQYTVDFCQRLARDGGFTFQEGGKQ